MFPYTDFKEEHPGLGNGWDPSMNQAPPAGYIPPSNSTNGPPQTTVISCTMPPHQNTSITDPIYSYPGGGGPEMNGFDYNQQQQPQQPFYNQTNQYYHQQPQTNNTSPTVNGGGGNNYIHHDGTYNNGYPQTQGPPGPPPPQGNGLTPPPSVQVPQNSPSQPPNATTNQMSYYQQCNPQHQPGMPPPDSRQTSPEQINYDFNGYPQHQQHFPPVNGHSQWSPSATHQQHYSAMQHPQQPYIKNDLDHPHQAYQSYYYSFCLPVP